MSERKNVLVTGGAGYIGSHTASLLKKKGFKVSILDGLACGRREVCRGFPLFQVDLKDKQAVSEVFQKNNFDAIIHFAAFALVGESVKSPDLYFENNVGGTINLLNAANKAGVKYLVFSSSAAVYGNPKKTPIPEDSPKSPTNPYGQTKLMVEEMLPWYESAYGLKFVSLRYFNACGAALDGKNGEAHKPETHIIPLLIRAALTKSSFSLFGNDYPTPDKTCVRDYIHVLDLADVHLRSLEYLAEGGISDYFNVGTGRGYSNLEIINTVKKITSLPIRLKIAPRRPGDPPKLVANPKKIARVLGWRPKHSSLKTIIETAYRWHKTHPFTLEE
jgi:UDP-glucose 4-epimerase